ncbi:hypothetical protein RE6C_03193 [Rhodopirellula europaea 6C]|uniref:Uncharacterized protein n=1 Tax=Rhodopirellula europaea 6C TaxID=1263867 RepID=M2AG56_9BACT|nr:hypothetical protein RE6C_03193 [Rhodopirellula europaea 6C]
MSLGRITSAMCGRRRWTCKQTKTVTTAAPSPSHGYRPCCYGLNASDEMRATRPRQSDSSVDSVAVSMPMPVTIGTSSATDAPGCNSTQPIASALGVIRPPLPVLSSCIAVNEVMLVSFPVYQTLEDPSLVTVTRNALPLLGGLLFTNPTGVKRAEGRNGMSNHSAQATNNAASRSNRILNWRFMVENFSPITNSDNRAATVDFSFPKRAIGDFRVDRLVTPPPDRIVGLQVICQLPPILSNSC